MAKQRIGFAGLVPLAFQAISLADSTAVGINSTVRALNPEMLYIGVETQPVRYRADGTDPTLSTGVVIPKDLAPLAMPFNNTAALKFQRTTGTAAVSVMAYKYN
jgi:hypothetical protein